MEPLKCENLPESERKRIRSLYCPQKMSNDMILVGEKQYCMMHNFLTLGRRDLAVRPEDIWIGGFARSGTRWLAEMTWLITNNLDFDTALSSPFSDRMQYYDFGCPLKDFEALPSPRYFHTHLPLSLLPPHLLKTSRIVYVVRDPRDVIVSFYHFCKSHRDIGFLGTLKEFYQTFREDLVVYTPYFKCLKEYLEERNNKNLLFLFYEDMKQELPSVIRKVAQFFEQSYSDDQLSRLSSHLQFTSMKGNMAMNNSETLGERANEMIRKGETGGWRKEFDEEMTRDAEQWIAENLRGTDLKNKYF